jgi:hypothetical protein
MEQTMWQLTGQIANLMQTTLEPAGAIAIAAIGIPAWCAGIIAIFYGRKLHDTAGIFVGIVAGVLLALQPLGALQATQPHLQIIFISVALGIAGMIGGMLVWRMAPALGFALVLMAVALNVLPQFSLPLATHAGIVLALGVVGVLAGLAFMEWSLVFSSSIAGALLVCLCLAVLLHLSDIAGWLLFAAFASLGIWVQSRDLLTNTHRRTRSSSLPA